MRTTLGVKASSAPQITLRPPPEMPAKWWFRALIGSGKMNKKGL